MNYRRVRIAVSVFFALMAVAFTVLWVWSYWNVGGIHWTSANNTVAGVQVIPGACRFYGFHSDTRATLMPGWLVDWEKIDPTISYGPPLDGRVRPFGGHLSLPTWLIALTSIAVAVMAWPRTSFQFRLSTLMIVMTLVAIVLGLAVWACR